MSSPKSEATTSTPPKGSNENAERLKTQGNALHVQGQYRAAYKKYSEAIKEDPTNAVLWANRAASGLAMKEYQHPL
jgi:Flp pilus assembly protein TadD